MAGEAEAFDDVRQSWPGRRPARRSRHPHHQQTNDHGDVAHRVDEEAPALADLCYKDPGNSRADDARPVEHGRVQRDGVHQIFLAHHVHQKRLPRGDVDRIHHPQKCGQYKYVPHLHGVGKRKGGQNKCQNHGRNLGADDHALAVEPIGGDPTQGRDQKYRDLAGESHRSQL